MNFEDIVNKTQNIIFTVDNNFIIKFISKQIEDIYGLKPSELEGRECFKAILGRTSPCKDCPVEKGDSNGWLVHDFISAKGDRIFFDARISKNNEIYVESLVDITKIKKELDSLRHESKRLKALQVTESMKKAEIQGSYNFIENIIDRLRFGVMVIDPDYNIVIMNEFLREQAGVEDTSSFKYCYNLYGNKSPCTDCPYTDSSILKTPKKVRERSVTVTFAEFNGFIIESVRDTTREIQLINEIKASNDEVQEKQRQMQLLNKDLLRMNDKLKAAQSIIDDELRQVGELQHSLLPKTLPDIKGFEFASFYTPAEHAGGDYYDCISMSNNYWGFTVADVSGHGTPAAVIMAMARAIMRSYTYDVISPAEALGMVNEILCDNVQTRDFVTMFYTVLDASTSEMRYSSAGHNPVFHFDKSQMMVHSITAEGLFMAVFPDTTFEEKSLKLDEGDIIFMYTDGLVEAMNEQREQYGVDRVISRIMMYSEATCERIIDEIMLDVKDFKGNLPFEDDVTILAFKKLNKE